jgi:hypothetical protein
MLEKEIQSVNHNLNLKKFIARTLVGISLMSPMVGQGKDVGESTINDGNNVRITDIVGGVETSHLINKEEERIVNKRFEDFLYGKGIYGDKKLKNQMFYSYLKKAESDLGFLGADNGVLIVQGVFLGHFESKDRNFVAIGIKNKESEREILLAEWLVDKMIDVYSFVPIRSEEISRDSRSHGTESFTSENDLLSFLDSNLLDRVVLFHFYNMGKTQRNYDNKKIPDYLNNYVAPKQNTNYQFTSQLLRQPNPYQLGLTGVGLVKSSENYENIGVVHLTDVAEKLSDNSNDFPLMAYIQYRINNSFYLFFFDIII